MFQAWGHICGSGILGPKGSGLVDSGVSHQHELLRNRTAGYRVSELDMDEPFDLLALDDRHRQHILCCIDGRVDATTLK